MLTTAFTLRDVFRKAELWLATLLQQIVTQGKVSRQTSKTGQTSKDIKGIFPIDNEQHKCNQKERGLTTLFQLKLTLNDNDQKNELIADVSGLSINKKNA